MNKLKKRLRQLSRGYSQNDLINKILGKQGSINLQYCHEKELYKKRFAFLKFKSAFFLKLVLMEENCQSITTIEKLHSWIDDNLDELYQNHKKSQAQLSRKYPEPHNQDQEHFEKSKFREFLLNKLDEIYLRRKYQKRVRTIYDTY